MPIATVTKFIPHTYFLKYDKGIKHIRVCTIARGEICTICRESFDEEDGAVKVNGCRHIYHPVCLSAWIEGEAKNTCPNCRAQTLRLVGEEEGCSIEPVEVALKRALFAEFAARARTPEASINATHEFGKGNTLVVDIDDGVDADEIDSKMETTEVDTDHKVEADTIDSMEAIMEADIDNGVEADMIDSKMDDTVEVDTNTIDFKMDATVEADSADGVEADTIDSKMEPTMDVDSDNEMEADQRPGCITPPSTAPSTRPSSRVGISSITPPPSPIPSSWTSPSQCSPSTTLPHPSSPLDHPADCTPNYTFALLCHSLPGARIEYYTGEGFISRIPPGSGEEHKWLRGEITVWVAVPVGWRGENVVRGGFRYEIVGGGLG
jgi:hypothetical protein